MIAPPPTDAQPLRLTRLVKAFDDAPVLSGVDLAVEPGTVLGLLGKNGAGKSTLIKCALGLLRPTEGDARVFGEEAWRLSAGAKARLGYAPQEFVTYPWMRVRQVIAYTAAFYDAWNHTLADDLCRRWDLPMEDRAGVLSTGQLQTLGLVLAMSHEPDLLVLDEPVASLDPAARRELLRTLIEIVDEGEAGGRRRAVLFSSHITSDPERIVGRMAILRGGRLAFDGGLDTLKERVKRLRLTARDADFPGDLAIRGALATRVEGRHAEATVAEFAPSLPAELARSHDADVAVVDLNLEEIFLGLHDDRA